MRSKEFIIEFDDDEVDLEPEADDDAVPVKGDAMQSQLMKIADSDDSDDIKNPVRSVMTDDGKELSVTHAEAEAILKLLQMDMKPEAKINIQKSIQTASGLQKMLAFVKDKGLA